MAHLDSQLTRPSARRRWWRNVRPPSPLLLILATLTAGLALLPLMYLIIRSTFIDPSSLADLFDRSTFRVLQRSMLLAAVVTTLALLIGVPLAWLTTRSDLPGRRIWLILAMLPMAVPSYIGAWAIVAVLGPRGLAQQWLAPFGVERLPSLYGFPGAALALALFGYPYVLLSVRVSLKRMDPALEEASRSLGMSARSTFWRVTLPQLRPAIASGGLLVALYTLSDFGAVSLMRYNVFTRDIYTRYRTFDSSGAAALSLVLVVLALLLLVAETMTRGKARYYRASAGAIRQARLVPLKAWRWPAFIFCVVIALLGVGLPLVAIGSWLIIGLRSGRPLNFQIADVGNSLLAASLAAVAAVVIALPLVVLAVRHPHWFTNTLERMAYISYGLPGIVVALALVLLGIRTLPMLYQTLPMLVLAHVVRFMPQASGSLRTSLLQVSPRLEEAAQSLGRRRWNVLRSITLPLMLPGMLSGAALVFLSTLKELPATLLLGPTGFDTLATDIWHQTTESQFSQTALPALVMMAAAAVSLALLLAQDRRS